VGLREQQKTERRRRILAAARKLIALGGYERLTMRELARESHVSVPTLYNLFGGKQALLLGELEETFAVVAAGLETARGRSIVARAFAACEAGTRELLAGPRYWRELVQLFLVADETGPVRRENEARYVAMMARLLAEGQQAGEVARWADPVVVARRMFAHYLHTMIEWAKGDLDGEEFRVGALFGMSLMLLGVARGRAVRELERRVRALQPALARSRAESATVSIAAER
jgi:AcrR family transcriptional regulator